MRYNHDGVISKIDEFPGCAQIGVFNYVFLPQHLRGKGKGLAAHQARLMEARRLGFDFLLCTVEDTNTRETHILEKFHWTIMRANFLSSKTGHYISLWGRKTLTVFDEGLGTKDEEGKYVTAEELSYKQMEEMFGQIKYPE